MIPFTQQAQNALRAAMDRIIPADDFPSASQNGVMDYFERQFAADLAEYVIFYRLGLAALDEEATAVFERPFADLPVDQQDQLLEAIETGSVAAHWPIDPRRFLDRLTDHVAEGYYADPEYNKGNPGKASWTMIGFQDRTGLLSNEERANG